MGLILLACVGLTFTIMYGEVFQECRAFFGRVGWIARVLDCALCTGFWSGVAIGVFLYIAGAGLGFAALALIPFASAILSMVADILLKKVEIVIEDTQRRWDNRHDRD
tara:strand:+ start:859 stop:1182 length:324 start_codon:yes stop_codon:yes gene_type:complete